MIPSITDQVKASYVLSFVSKPRLMRSNTGIRLCINFNQNSMVTIYRIRKIVVKSYFAEQFRKLINRSKGLGYNPYIMRQTACLVVNPITVDSYALLFNCTKVVRASDSMTASSLSFHKWVGDWCFVLGLARRGSTSSFL